MNVEMKSVDLRNSAWSMPRNTIIGHQTSLNSLMESNMRFNSISDSIVNRPNSREFSRKKLRLPWNLPQCCLSTACWIGFIMGLLIGGLILAIVISFWKTSASTTATNTTTVTSTSTTSTTTMSTISNMCTGGTLYTTQLLYLDLIAMLPWTQYSFNYTAPNINSATIMFALRDDPGIWSLDDVSITDKSGNELLSNGDFEQGYLASWIYCNPSNGTYGGYVGTGSSYDGSYSYLDGVVGVSDYLSQAFTVTPYSNYSITFWLSTNSNSVTFAQIYVTS
ncbi:unnamed protein product [Adineta steineri]|uniref:Uncharacterized protein n=1 Tax=Adineta steineri TaxID=433720 RepID=A0A814ZG08_9BILA|nr:unnamed protein product [Adineta steineri]CAF4048550.1 unnamed protein product [Adineta steineri]